MEITEEHWQADHHRPGAVDFIYLSGFTQRRFDNVAVIVVIFDVMTEDVGSHFDGQDVINDQFAVAGQIVASFVQFLDFSVLVLLIVVFFDEDVALDEVVQRLLQRAIRLVDQGTQQRIVFQLLTELHQQIAYGKIRLRKQHNHHSSERNVINVAVKEKKKKKKKKKKKNTAIESIIVIKWNNIWDQLRNERKRNNPNETDQTKQ